MSQEIKNEVRCAHSTVLVKKGKPKLIQLGNHVKEKDMVL